MKSYLENLQIDCWLHTGRALGRVQPCICMRAESARAGLVLRAVNELSCFSFPLSPVLPRLQRTAEALCGG